MLKRSFLPMLAMACMAVGVLAMSGVAYAAAPTLSQNGLTVGLGQSLTVTAQNGVSVYMLLSSSPSVASVYTNGTQVTVTGQGLGSTAITICAVGTSSDCTTLNVTVQAGSVAGISFSQSNLSLSVGTNQSVTVTGGNGSYTVSNNSNTSVVSTSLSGNTLTVSGVAAGSATIKVCDTSNNCGTLSVTSNASSVSGLSFSPNNVSLATGNSQIVGISGGNGTYLISSNSNSSAVSAGTSSTGVTVFGSGVGSAVVKVCDTSNVCGTFNVTVTGSTASQAVIFSVASPTLAVGQNMNVSLSGGATNYLILSNSNSDAVQASMLNNSTISLTGTKAGTASLTVCAGGGGGCNPLTVTVTGTAAATTTTTVPPVVTPVTPVVTPVTPSASVVVNATLLAEIQTLQSALVQILTQVQSMQTQIGLLLSQVNAGSGSTATANTSAVTNTSSGTYNFTELLNVGSQDAEVTALQQQLTKLGFYSGPITGFYGAATKQAVTKYQTSRGLSATGYVGPGTRALLNAGN